MSATISVERRRRGVFGWLFLATFWLFQAACGVFAGAVIAAPSKSASPEAELFAFGLLSAGGATLWIVGTLFLGALVLVTRGKRVTITKPA